MTTYDPEWGRQKKAELDEVRKQTAARVMAASAAGELRNPNKAEGGSDLFGLEERCAREWASDPAIRAEFQIFERYVAFMRASLSGRARILGGEEKTLLRVVVPSKVARSRRQEEEA